jgi:hypothetical protein
MHERGAKVKGPIQDHKGASWISELLFRLVLVHPVLKVLSNSLCKLTVALVLNVRILKQDRANSEELIGNTIDISGS